MLLYARRSGRQAGASAIELAIALPVLFLLGLGALQWGLVFHARQALEHAVVEAARAGSVGSATMASITTGLARGLLPYWASSPGVRTAPGREAAVAAARLELERARAQGWIVLRRIAPTREAFSDWGEAELDGFGRAIPGSTVIPNDSLAFAQQRNPRTGSAGTHLALPIGSASGQTLTDANLLKLELAYGVPLDVPFVGRVAASLLRRAGGCPPPERGGCLLLDAPDARGASRPRWLLVASATIRMQSAARLEADTPSGTSASGGPVVLPGWGGASPGTPPSGGVSPTPGSSGPHAPGGAGSSPGTTGPPPATGGPAPGGGAANPPGGAGSGNGSNGNAGNGNAGGGGTTGPAPIPPKPGRTYPNRP